MERGHRPWTVITVSQMINFLYELLLCWFIVHRIFVSTYLESFCGISISSWGVLVSYALPCLLFLIFLIEGIFKQITRKRFYFSILIIVLLLAESIYIRDTTLINTFLFIVVYPEKLNIKKLAVNLSIAIGVSIIFILIICNMGLLPDIITHREENLRHSGGFVSANALANNIAIGCMILFYGKIDTWKVRHTLFYLILGLLVYTYTYSRMATVFILVLSVIGLFYKYIIEWKISRITYFLTSYLFPVLSAFMISVTVYFSNNVGSALYVALNDLFTTRLYWCTYYYSRYGLSVFGKYIETYSAYLVQTEGGSWMGLDNSYMMISIKFGLIFIVIFSLVYFFLGRRMKKTGDLAGAILAVIFLLMGITENYLYSAGYNFTLLIFAYEFLLKSADREEITDQNKMQSTKKRKFIRVRK